MAMKSEQVVMTNPYLVSPMFCGVLLNLKGKDMNSDIYNFTGATECHSRHSMFIHNF